jgi:hypothetical protein
LLKVGNVHAWQIVDGLTLPGACHGREECLTIQVCRSCRRRQHVRAMFAICQAAGGLEGEKTDRATRRT